MSVIQFTAEDLSRESLANKGTVLVDLWAAWCGPCRMVAPVVEQLSGEYDGRVVFGKLNIDEYSDKAIELGVSSIPTLILFKDGAEKERIVGAYPAQAIKQFIERNL